MDKDIYKGIDKNKDKDKNEGKDRIKNMVHEIHNDSVEESPDADAAWAEERRRRIRERQKRRNQQVFIYRLILLVCVIAAVILAAMGITRILKHNGFGKTGSDKHTSIATAADLTASETTEAPNPKTALLTSAERLAAMYDYDGAISLLQGSEYGKDSDVGAAISDYEARKGTLQPADNSKIPHVFFHTLIVDTTRALTNDRLGQSFNSVMTTIPEFEAILQQLYERGYVLVGMHDIAEMETQSDGTEKMVQKQIMLPEGKKPIVISEDDVNYYEYMQGHGFADKMVLDADGKLKLQYTDADGNVSVGDYDIVPILDQFIEEHPDFSYHGHKAIIAFTGYNGVLGYRTDETYDAASEAYDPKNTANPNIEADRETVKTLTKALVEDGYELASHSWGHINFTDRSLEDLTRDTDRWQRNVASLLPGPVDIMLYPYGADIQDWHPYDAAGNQKFVMLENAGFRYFCNVDSNPYWVQFGDNFVRQGRRNLDGYRLYEAYSGGTDHVSDLMDIKQVFDTRRPTPIGWNYGSSEAASTTSETTEAQNTASETTPSQNTAS